MNGCLTRLCIFVFICASSLAARPDEDEVHIAVDGGHFIKNSAFGSHHEQKGSQSEKADQQKVHKRPAHHAREHKSSLMQEHEQHLHQAHEHLSPQHQLLKSQWERAKRDFYKDAATSYEYGASGNDGNHVAPWTSSVLFWICRILFLAAAIYSLLRYSSLYNWQHMQAKCFATALRCHKEFRSPLDAAKETAREVAALSRPARQPSDVSGEAEQETSTRVKASEPFEEQILEHLGKVIDDRLCEVTRWLQHGAESPGDAVSEKAKEVGKEIKEEAPPEPVSPLQEEALAEQVSPMQEEVPSEPVSPSQEAPANLSFSGQ